jgi:hypothetical protein
MRIADDDQLLARTGRVICLLRSNVGLRSSLNQKAWQTCAGALSFPAAAEIGVIIKRYRVGYSEQTTLNVPTPLLQSNC